LALALLPCSCLLLLQVPLCQRHSLAAAGPAAESEGLLALALLQRRPPALLTLALLLLRPQQPYLLLAAARAAAASPALAAGFPAPVDVAAPAPMASYTPGLSPLHHHSAAAALS
jgi:hypothetical protein